MGSPVSSSQFMILLETYLKRVMEQEYGEIEEQRNQLFTSVPSDKAWETYFSVSGIGDATLFNGKIPYVAVYPEYQYRIEANEYANGIQYERKFLDDKQYKVLGDTNAQLASSMKRAMEKSGVGIFANAFSNVYQYMYSEEGLSLCNTAHTTKSGVSTSTGFSNSGTSALSKTAINATYLAMRQFKGSVGERVDINPDTIIVPESLENTVYEALGYDPRTKNKSTMDPDSANRMINTANGRFNVVSLRRLDDYSSTQWYMVDSKYMKKDLLWIDRIKPEFKVTVDTETLMTKASVYARWGCGPVGWRWVYGHKPS